MRRRWFGVFLLTWALVAPLFTYAPVALAAGETYNFQDANTIIGTGDLVGSKTPITFKKSGSDYTYSTLRCALTITNVTGTTGGPYTGNIKGQCSGNMAGVPGAISITDTAKKGPVVPGATGSATATDTTPPVVCDAGDGGFGWIICGGITMFVGWIDWIRANIIVPFIQEKPLDDTDPNIVPIKGIWSAFRNIASVFFILIFFLVIFGTAIGWNNYTIKKILPRLIAGAILVPFSWYICVVVIDIGNVLGQGLVSLSDAVYASAHLKAPAFDFSSGLSQGTVLGTSLAGVTAAGFALSGAVAGITWGILITIVIGFLTVFLTLVLRKILIMMLIVLSPLALIAWILPNTNKFFSDWWKNFWKLVMMYPIIMGFFVASKLFATVAPGIVGNGPGNAVAVPVIQLAALTMPLFGIPLAFKMAGAGLSMGKGAIDRIGGATNGRFGKDSQMAKDWTANRKQKNLLAEKRGFEKGGLGGRLQGSYNKVRSGHATGFLGTGRNLGSINPFMPKNIGKKYAKNAAQQMAYDKALGDAYAGHGVVDAARRSSKLPSETHTNRLAYEGQAALNQKADGRSGRAGLVKAVNENSQPGQNFEQAGNALASQRQSAGTTTTKRNESTTIGQNRAVNRGERINPQAGHIVAKDAEYREDTKQAQLRHATTSNIKTTDDIEHGIAVDAIARGVPVAMATDPEAIRQYRLTSQVGRAAATATKQEVAAAHGSVVAQNAIDDVRPETTDQLVAAAYSAEREKAATAKADRTQRLVVDASGRGAESTSQVYTAAAETARGKLAAAKGDRAGIRLAAGTMPVTTQTLVRSAEIDSQKKLAASLGTVLGTIESANIAARDGGYTPGSLAADQASIVQAAQSGRIVQTGRGLQTHADEQATIDNDEEQRNLAKAEGRDYHADLIEGGYQTASANLGKQTGALVGAAKNARALAGEPQAPSAAKNVKSGIVAGVKAAAETAGAATGAARVYGATTSDRAAKQLSQKAATEASFSALESVSQARGYNDAVKEEEDRLMEEQVKKGLPANRAKANAQILANVRKAGQVDGQDTGTKRVGKAQGTAEGYYTALENEKADALKTGRAPLVADARRNLLRNATGKAQREASNSVTGDASENRGIAVTRAGVGQAVAEELAKQDGHDDFNTLSPGDKARYMDQASTKIDRDADTTDFLAGQKKVTDGAAKALGTARAYEAAVQGRIANPDDASSTVAQARQGIVTAAVKTGEESENIRAGLVLGQDQGALTTNEAAIERARNTLDTKIEEGVTTEDVFLEDKDENNQNIRIKAGELVPAGAVLTEASAQSLGLHLDRTQARAKISSRAIAAGDEKGVREQASIQGNVAALAQAAAAGTATSGQRLAAYTQAETDKLATDTAQVSAQDNLSAPGRVLHRDFGTSVADAQRVREQAILGERVTQAARSTDMFDGVPVEAFELNSSNIDKAVTGLKGNLKDNLPLAIALGGSLNRSNGAFNKLISEVREKPIEQGGFGGNFWEMSDPIEGPELKTVWTDMATTNKSEDAKKPTMSVAQSMTTEGASKLSKGVMERTLNYYENAPKEIDRLITRSDTKIEEADTTIANPSSTAIEIAAARKKRDRAQKAKDAYTHTRDTHQWTEHREKFDSTIQDAISKASAPNSKVDFDQDALIKLAERAQAAKDQLAKAPGDPDYDPNYDQWLNDDSIDAILTYADSRKVKWPGKPPPPTP
ncbi:MAG: hypothetical protein JWN01_1135 [Patescibacteria group bacterium]|nr:hypothetical protein [Patescibacteria group bacterium]